MTNLDRSQILPEPKLPELNELMGEGQEISETISIGDCPFLTTYDVQSESEYKRRQSAKGTIMLHAQIGYRSLQKTSRAYFEIYEKMRVAGYIVDRYGICLDWSMGYPADRRVNMPRGTGLILEKQEDFAELTNTAPVAPHFGDFMIGTPASVENTIAALNAGATTIGNIGQYFTFRMPRWKDDIGTTVETIRALALCAAQPLEIMIHSNLDDGFAALFCDMSCSIGATLLERYIVEELIGGHITHCYGHTYSDPLTRLAFQRALAQVTESPGSMVYGNTTIYVSNEIENYANLASYLMIDIVAQRTKPTGHAINPVPVTEAMRIPDINEIVEAQLFANRLIQRAEGFESIFDLGEVDLIATKLVRYGKLFKKRVLTGLNDAGIDTTNPFELLLSIRRIGAKKLEELFGPGESQRGHFRGRVPIVKVSTLTNLEKRSKEISSYYNKEICRKIKKAAFVVCLTCTDVHEYGKILVEKVLKQIGIRVIDAGVSTDPDLVVEQAKLTGADFIAISTYNGVALSYLQSLRKEMNHINLNLPIFIGGRLNQILDESESSLPIDVTDQLRNLGAIVCYQVEDMVERLCKIALEMKK
ncbi:MAG: cobalamin-dependent protein [Candidatus Hodarchaeales archaeon]|jgi:methylmalonyl-CoA mutase cobalamin-binding subunit